MEYQEFLTRTQQVSELINSARLQEAVDSLYQLLLSDISDVDKIVICTDLARVYDRMGKTDEAISWFDKGIDLEKNYSRYGAAELKAKYLSQFGRIREAVQIFEALIKRPFLSEADKERMRKTIQVVLGRSTSEWK